MPRRPKRPAPWTDKVPKAAVRAALEDALTDAFGEYEEHAGLLALIEDQLRFSFQARVVGEEVTVTGMASSEHGGFGLDLVCQRNGKGYAVEARSVEVLAPLPKGHEYLAAYLDWTRRR